MKEDFNREGKEDVECYLLRKGGDDDDEYGVRIDICVEEERCPSGYPGVCCFICFNVLFILFCL
jgi:hypothetical protein